MCDLYILKQNGKRIFATSLFQEFQLKQRELIRLDPKVDSLLTLDSEFLKDCPHEMHLSILRECTENIMLKMTDKS